MATTREDFLGALGALVVQWNHAEALLNALLSYLSGGGARIEILAAHMNTVAVCQALRTLANDKLTDDDVAPHVIHYADCFERLREYRNYYVHGIKAVGISEGEAVGIAETVTARQRWTLHQLVLSIDDLRQTILLLTDLVRYGSNIMAHLMWTHNKSLPISEENRSLSEKLPLPDKLQKPRLFLLSRTPTHGANSAGGESIAPSK